MEESNNLCMENYNVETSALHRKLQSKIEALRIVREQMETFRTERDQFKLMAETLQLRYSALKYNTDYSKMGFEGKSSVVLLLNETHEKNIKLTTEVETLRQRIIELKEDIQVLRNSHQDVSTTTTAAAAATTTLNNENFEKLIENLETIKKKNVQLSFDLKCILDEKEEAVTERDAYKCKVHRLNHELAIALKVNKIHPGLVDIDGIILENNYLHEKLKNYENEFKLAQKCITKYKNILDIKKKKGIIKLGTNNASIMSHKQVKSALDSDIDLPPKAETIADLKSLCLALLDNLNDKNLALSHQKQTNKILANRNAELEKRLKILTNDYYQSKTSTTFSPSEILLNTYCPSTVDNQPLNSSNFTDDSGTISSDESVYNKNVNTNNENDVNNGKCNDDNVANNSDDDDGDDEDRSSNQSVVSSEYNSHDIFPINQKQTETQQIDNNSIVRERLEELKDLPPELSELVQKALEKLDMEEKET